MVFINLVELVFAIIGLAGTSKWLYDHRNDGSALPKLYGYFTRS